MKLFGHNIRYSPEETALARWEAITGGAGLRRAARIRAYIVTTERDLFEKYWITRSFLDIVRMRLVSGFRYLFDRLKYGRLSSHSRISPPPEICRRPAGSTPAGSIPGGEKENRCI